MFKQSCEPKQLADVLINCHVGVANISDQLSPNGKYHFNNKLSYMTNSQKIVRTWKDIRYHLEMWNFDVSGARILDLGCGVGYTSIYFAAAGADCVVGLDPREGKIAAFQGYVSCLPDDIKARIKIVKSGIEHVEYREEFDLVYAREAISHIVGDGLFKRLHGMLRAGGLLYIKDGNNELCKRYKKGLYEFWERVENGPPGKVGSHNVEFVYKELREELIKRWYGNRISHADIGMLAENTAYLYGSSLRMACDSYLRDGIRPTSKYNHITSPIHPELGYYIEKLFNPYHLRKELIDTGFRQCRLYGQSGHSKGLLVKLIFSLLPLRLKYSLHPTFIAIAKK